MAVFLLSSSAWFKGMTKSLSVHDTHWRKQIVTLDTDSAGCPSGRCGGLCSSPFLAGVGVLGFFFC